MSKSLSGSCVCGGVSFVLQNARAVVNCHCESCRKFHGNFAALTKVDWADIQIAGEENIAWYRKPGRPAQRGFCKQCGASLFWQLDNEQAICVAAAALDLPTALTTAKNIYTNEASDFYHLGDNLPNYPTTMKNTKPTNEKP